MKNLARQCKKIYSKKVKFGKLGSVNKNQYSKCKKKKKF